VFRRPVVLMLVLLAALVVPASASAAIDYPDFSSTAGLQLNGDAKQVGNVVQLTPAENSKGGAVYSATPLNPQESFENQFAISMHDSTTSPLPADGIAFMVQSEGVDAGAGLGGSLGYDGVAPSVIVEFDIFHNFGEPLTDHVSIMTEGDGTNHLACANAGPTPTCTSDLPFPLYGAPVFGWVEYDAVAGHLRVWVSQTSTKPAAPLLDHPISLAPLGSSGYVGFTAATGASNAVQDVLSWRQGALGSLNPVIPPVTSPLPATTEQKKAKKGCGKKKAKGKNKGKGKKKGAAASKKKKKKCKKKKKKGKGKGKAKGHAK
jgi:Legume lectin domain